MKISTKELDIEIEPELLTDEQLGRLQKLLDMALAYERAKRQLRAEITGPTRSATKKPKQTPKPR